MNKRIIFTLSSILLIALLTACSGKNQDTGGTSQTASAGAEPGSAATELFVQFGSGSDSFTLFLEDNDTAAAIARHVGSADWQLPIYHFDDYDGWEFFQYYDIPSRYDIPSHAETVTSERAGQVYYSEPNRIILFYHDAEISGEYTLAGRFEATEEFVTAVEENPVLDSWGNKIVRISAGA